MQNHLLTCTSVLGNPSYHTGSHSMSHTITLYLKWYYCITNVIETWYKKSMNVFILPQRHKVDHNFCDSRPHIFYAQRSIPLRRYILALEKWAIPSVSPNLVTVDLQLWILTKKSIKSIKRPKVSVRDSFSLWKWYQVHVKPY